jgi:hypothetical protein
MATNVQEGVKTSSVSLAGFLLRLVSGSGLGLTLGLIGQELSGYGTFSLILCAIVVLGLFMKISSSWRIWHVLIFDLICILVAQLLRMYILLAP